MALPYRIAHFRLSANSFRQFSGRFPVIVRTNFLASSPVRQIFPYLSRTGGFMSIRIATILVTNAMA